MSDFESSYKVVIEDMILDTLSKASKAMEKMLKIRVRSEHVKIGKGPLKPIPELDQLGRFKVHVVRVGLHGEIGGAFYFLVNSHEVDLINQVCLPEPLNPNTHSENKLMKHGFMSEIENMIAALAVAEISDSLGVQLMIGVPEIQIMPGHSVNNYLIKENLSHDTQVHVSSILTGVVVNIAPHFIWMLDKRFMDTLRLNIVS